MGNLYARQGTSYPVDVIVIEGRGKSSRRLPAAELPQVYSSYEALKELVPNVSLSRNPNRVATSDRGQRDVASSRDPGATSTGVDPTVAAYLNLLMQRVDWMIQQEASQEAAWELMRNAVRRAQLDAIQLPQTAGLEPDALPDSTAWAEAMTLHNLEFQEMLQAVKPLDAKDYLFNFPSPTTSETAAVEQVQSVIQTTTLSEWLELMVDLCQTN